MFLRMGGGAKGFLKNVKNNCTFLAGWLPQLKMGKVHAIFALGILDVRSTHHADSVDEGQEGVEVHVRVAVRLCHLK